MRRLLFLAAILFMAPIASGVTVSLNDTGTTVMLSVYGYGEPEIFNGIAMVIEAPGVLSNFFDGPAAPSWVSMFPITINDDSGMFWMVDYRLKHFDGVWLFAEWSASTPVLVSAYKVLLGEDIVLMDQIQVPEPMTVVLLGLGGLLILRNRRT